MDEALKITVDAGDNSVSVILPQPAAGASFTIMNLGAKPIEIYGPTQQTLVLKEGRAGFTDRRHP